MSDREQKKEEVLRLVKEKDVKFIRLWFTDILGFLKSFAITQEELDKALEDGIGFDGSSIQGFVRIEESDMMALPDPSTFCLLPWRPKEKAVARMFCDIYWPGGKPFEGDPRGVLKRNLERAAKMGFTFYVGPELEFFLFKNAEKPEPIDKGGYFDLIPPDLASDFRRDAVLTLEEMGIKVEVSHHEVAYSQHEIDLRYADALTMADNVMTYRIVIKQIAQKHGFFASFMPKPIMGINGSGMHVHMSLFKDGKNAFFNPNDEYHLSKIAKHFMAGLLKHAPEITAVTSQWVNSYKRLVPGYEAPVYITWATRNRSDLIRLPEYKPGKEEATRIEYRAPDPACNPYLAFSVILAAGLEGIEKEYELPPPVTRNVFEMSPQEREELGIKTLPGSLLEAIQIMEKSELIRKALGDHIFYTFIQNKKLEWQRYHNFVSEYEIEHYFPLL